MLEQMGVVNCLPVATGKAYKVESLKRSIPVYIFISEIKLAILHILSSIRLLDHH